MNEHEKDFTRKTMEWYSEAYAAITKAGGYPEHIIKRIDESLLEDLIRNNIRFHYVKEKEKEETALELLIRESARLHREK